MLKLRLLFPPKAEPVDQAFRLDEAPIGPAVGGADDGKGFLGGGVELDPFQRLQCDWAYVHAGTNRLQLVQQGQHLAGIAHDLQAAVRCRYECVQWHQAQDRFSDSQKGATGNPNGAAALRRAGKGAVALRAAVSANAAAYAQDLAQVVADIRASGATSLRAVATELNARGMMTRRGGEWRASNVRNLVRRLNFDLRR